MTQLLKYTYSIFSAKLIVQIEKGGRRTAYVTCVVLMKMTLYAWKRAFSRLAML